MQSCTSAVGLHCSAAKTDHDCALQNTEAVRVDPRGGKVSSALLSVVSGYLNTTLVFPKLVRKCQNLCCGWSCIQITVSHRTKEVVTGPFPTQFNLE